jgi:hypothetical protein
MIKHTYFSTMELLNKWYNDCDSKVEIISISYELLENAELHHVYYKVK